MLNSMYQHHPMSYDLYGQAYPQAVSLFDGSFPIQWGLISPNSDAVFRVTAYDRYGNQLPFYTGTKDAPVLCQSDGATDDGILLCDLSNVGDASDFAGIAYLLMYQGLSANDWVCADADIPGMPDGTVKLFIELTSADSDGNGIVLAPIGWDMRQDGVIDTTNITTLALTSWFTGRGLSARYPAGLAQRVDSSARVRLLNAGDSVEIGWGANPWA